MQTHKWSCLPPLPVLHPGATRVYPCIGYLAHPFVKEALWAFIAASFSLSGGTQP